MMSCVLCMESLVAPECVNINSEGVLCMLEKYFSWLKVDDIYSVDSCICHQCWQALLTFHNFYVQVERAHKILERDLKPTENFVLAKQLSLAEAAPMDEEDTEAAIGQIKIEPETIYSEIVRAERRQSLPLPQDPKVVELYAPTVMDENLDLVEALQPGNLSEAKGEPDQTFDNDLEFISEADNPVALKKPSKIKRVYSTKMWTSSESDEFVAKNFKLCCSICSVTVENFNALQTHFRAQHHSRGYALCCGKKLWERRVLIDHIHTHNDPAYLCCPRCGKQLASRKSLKQHLQWHDNLRRLTKECRPIRNVGKNLVKIM